MRHAKYGGKLGRTSAHRKAMLRNLVTSLLERERVETTDAKAKELRRLADRMITLGKRGDLHARRQALSVIRRREVTAKVFDELAERFRTRPGGYTRVLKTRHRAGDAAPLSIVELVEGGPAAGAESAKGTGGKAARGAGAKAAKPAAAKPARKKAARKPSAEAAEKPAGAKKKAGSRKAPRAKKKSE